MFLFSFMCPYVGALYSTAVVIKKFYILYGKNIKVLPIHKRASLEGFASLIPKPNENPTSIPANVRISIKLSPMNFVILLARQQARLLAPSKLPWCSSIVSDSCSCLVSSIVVLSVGSVQV